MTLNSIGFDTFDRAYSINYSPNEPLDVDESNIQPVISDQFMQLVTNIVVYNYGNAVADIYLSGDD